MFQNYLKIAYRNFVRHKLYSFINVTGLAIGLACTLLILLWVKDELSYDRFHENKDQIYRVLSSGREADWFGLPAPFAPAVIEEIPEVKDAVRILQTPRFVFTVGNQSFYEDNGITADPGFFRIFSFPLLQGDPEKAFEQPLCIVLTESLARKYFGGDDPMGRTIKLEGEVDLKVVGVLADVPSNSHFRFDYILPHRFAESVGICGMEWGDFNFRTYLLTTENKDEVRLTQRLNEVAERHGCPQIVEKLVTFITQALPQIYLNPHGSYDIPLGDKKYVILFSAIAFFILFIACINFINLSTARSEKRAKEVGLRKVIGAGRKQMIRQFFGESAIMTVLSVILAVGFAHILTPLFNQLTLKEMTLNIFSPDVLLGLLSLVLIVGIAAGLYPALYLSSFQPVNVLQGRLDVSRSGQSGKKGFVRRGALRRVLVIAQFSLSIILILATMVVDRQLHFIHEKSWSMEQDQVLTIPFKENIGSQYDLVKNRLLEHPAITAVGAKDVIPTTLRNNTMGIGWEGKREDQSHIHMETTRIDENYFKVMDLQIVQGRGFDADHAADRGTAFILNEEAIRLAELDDPIGKRFRLYGTVGTIAGVVQNVFFQDLRQQLRGQVYHLFTDLPSQSFTGAVFIRVRGGTRASTLDDVIAHVRTVWSEVNSYAPFEFHFLDDTIDAQYQTEQRLGRLFSTFAFLAIFISCLGLFGLASFIAERRTKEIGIRKVLGSSVTGLVILLSKEMTKWVLIASLVAWPIAWLIMNRWLENFIYRIQIGIGIFLASAALAMLIAITAVSFQSIKAALANPVKALRYE